MTRSRRRNSLQSTLKDYLVPIIGGVLILILIYSFLGNDDTSSKTVTLEAGSTELSFNDSDTEAFIIYPGEVKEKITSTDSLNIDDTIVVESGSVTLTPDDGNTIHLNKIAEFKINSDGSYNLYSSDAWIGFSKDTNVSMRYANISAPANATVSLTQNEAGSTVYVLAGDVKVSNLAGVSTLITKGQKVSISRVNAAKDDLDLAGSKTSIDSYFKGSDWFIANNGNAVLTAEDVVTSNATVMPGSASGATVNSNEPGVNPPSTTGGAGASTLYMKFDTLKDEMTFADNTLKISGNVLSASVGSITVDNTQVAIGVDRRFTLSGISIPNKINDLVVKVYDTNQALLDKQVYTIYSSAEGAGSNALAPPLATTETPLTSGATTFEVDATKFGFTAPSVTGKFSTSGSEVTLRGYTTAKGISKVQVNGFTLNSFNGANWRYHAFKRFSTLKDGSNQYKIDYFTVDGKVAYTDYFTIVKKPEVVAPVEAQSSGVVAPQATEAQAETEEESLFAD